MANTVMGLGGNMVIWQLLGIALIVAPNHNLGPLDIDSWTFSAIKTCFL